MKGILEALALNLKIRNALDVEEAFIDGSFAPAKKGLKKGSQSRENKTRQGNQNHGDRRPPWPSRCHMR